MKKFGHEDTELGIRLRRHICLLLNLNLCLNLYLHLNPSLLRKPLAEIYPQMLGAFLESLPGLILADKRR